MLQANLVAEKTVASAKGEGPVVNLSHAQHRVFLLNLAITDIVEQEALDVAIHGSADGETWDAKPIIAFPQKFYRGESPLSLDLREHPNVKFVRARWDVNRWGRGPENPHFEFCVTLAEVSIDIWREAEAQARSLA
jgi:hypothetical protein